MTVPVTRLGDLASSHECFPTIRNIQGSPNVFVNGLPVVRLGDPYEPHSCPDHGIHQGQIVSGSSTVFVNGLPIARIGDPLNCGSRVIMGSPTVFSG